MATMLQLPSFPRHGILLNSSPSTSPYNHPTSLPGTPHLISSLSSLSSSASSSSPHNSEADHYFLTASVPARSVASSAPRSGASTSGTGSNTNTLASRDTKRSSLSAPQTRKIRFAPLPEPRRDELPDVFLDDDAEVISSLPLSPSSLDTPRGNTALTASARANSLLFSGTVAATEAPADTPTPTTSTTLITPAASSSNWNSSVVPMQIAPSTSGSDRYDSDTDLMTPQSPSAVLSSSSSFIERYPYPQSCPESPIGRRVDLPRENRRWSTKKLFKPLFGPLAKKDISTEDVLTLGLNQLVRSSTRDSDCASSGATTPLRNRSRERQESISGGSEKDVDFGVPLSRSTSECSGAKKQSKKKSLLSSLMGSDSSSSTDGGLWRTQSATADIRRTKSRESTISNENMKRARSNSTGVANGRPGQRKQLKMLNGRVYGAKRNMNNVNLFANARSEDEFVEWGYGGMGSVKTAASVGNNKYTRVQGSAALGSSDDAGWSKGRVQPSTDDDDGSGMAWVKRRREERERLKREAAQKATTEAATSGEPESKDATTEEHKDDKPHADVSDPDPPAPVVPEDVETKPEAERSTPIAIAEVTPEHVTTAVKVPVHTPSPRHHNVSLGHHPHGHPMRLSAERTPSYASRHSLPRTPERRGSADTARAGSPMPHSVMVDAQEIVGEMEGVEEEKEEAVEASRERRESQSSTSTASEDEDADAEYSPKEEEEDEDDDEEQHRRTALGAGVEKISRHKSSHSQDGGLATPSA